jgi:cell division protein FtsZ
VGSTIKGFASEDAQVVVGTVIDPELEDELRVTVVATGLGQPRQQPSRPRAVARNAEGQVDYEQMDRPTVMRNTRRAAGDGISRGGGDDDIEYLDIPAFLRRQAD